MLSYIAHYVLIVDSKRKVYINLGVQCASTDATVNFNDSVVDAEK